MADNELLIKINADSKNASKAFDDLKGQTEDLEGQLSNVAKISAIGFGILTAEIGLSVHAFAEAEAASRELSRALQVQGLATEQVTIETANGETQVVSITEAYKAYAEQVQELTGIDDDAIIKAQALAQGYLGQTKVTKELTLAIADLSTKYGGDLNAAAEAIGRTIGTQTNAFARQGLVLSDTATKAERTAAVLDFVNSKFKGAAESANEGLGSVKGLATAFGNLQEAIGARFAPIITAAISSLTKLFKAISDNPELVNLSVSLIAAGAAVTALGVALPIAAQAFLTLRAALAAAQVSLTGTQIAIRGLIGATGIGLLVIAVTELALNWDTVFPRMQAVLAGFITFATQAFSGLQKVISGALSLDIDQITAGLSEVQEAFKKGTEEATAEIPKATQKAVTEQDAILASGAKQREDREKGEAQRRSDLRTAENELIKLQLTSASSEAIKLKTQEVDILKKLESEKNEDTIALLQERREAIIALEDEQRQQDIERKAAFLEEDLAAQAELDELNIDSKRVLREQDIAEAESALLTERETERKIATEILQDRVKNRNLELEDRKKYGVAVAEINSILRSQEVSAAKTVAGELVDLANSKNSELKAIGKAAALASIAINTATSAVTIAKQVIEVIPFPFNIPVAAALSAARIAYGAEQAGKVAAAKEGGLVTGGIPGTDSVPILAEPGELIVPSKLTPTFLDVVGRGGNGGGNSDLLPVLQSIDSKLSQPNQTIINGDILSDSSYVDALIEKINDRLRFGNVRLAADGT